MFNPFRAVKRLFTKSIDETRILAMLNGNPSLIVGDVWSLRRAEYGKHFNGWHYVFSDAIATAVAGMIPQYAFKREETSGQMSKARKKCLDFRQRQKAITGIAPHIDLEPVSSNHPLVRLDQRPNPLDGTGFVFRYKRAMFLETHGEAYRINFFNGVTNYPVASYMFPPHWVWPVPGNGRLIDRYEIRPTMSYSNDSIDPGRFFFFGGANGKFDVKPEHVVRYFRPDTETLYGAKSPIGATSAWTDSADNIDSSRVYKFQNSAFPDVGIEMDKDVDPATITQPEIDRFKAMFKQKYAGVMRTGEPVFLGPGMRMVVIRATPKEMDYCEGFGQMRDSLGAAHNTGPVIVGIGNETTFAAARAVDAGWHTRKITPITTQIADVDTEFMCRPYDEDLICYYNRSIPEDLEFDHKQRTEGFDRDCLTVREYRSQLGYPPLEGESAILNDKTASAIAAHFSVPQGVGEGMDEPVSLDESGSSIAAGNRLDNIFKPKQNGNGHSSLLNSNGKLRSLILPERFFLDAKD